MKKFSANAKNLRLGFFANIFEWYEFSIFAYLSKPLSQIFFPKTVPFLSYLSVWGIFSISYIVRPLGGILLGRLADRFSFRKIFIFSLLMMALPSIFIGGLPTYNQIGGSAAVLLLSLRIIQGFFAGGEFPLGLYYFSEIAEAHRKKFYISVVAVSTLCGLGLAACVAFFLFYIFSAVEVQTFAWRFPFLFCIPLSMLIFLMRLKLSQPLEKNSVSKVENNPAHLTQGILLMASIQLIFYVLMIWLPSHLIFKSITNPIYIYLGNIPALFIMGISTLLSGYYLDKYPMELKLYKGAAFFMAIGFILFFCFFVKHFYFWQYVLSGLSGIFNVTSLIFLINGFNQKNKGLSVSICYSVGAAVGGMVPFLIEALVYIKSSISALGIALTGLLLGSLACLLNKPKVNNAGG